MADRGCPQWAEVGQQQTCVRRKKARAGRAYNESRNDLVGFRHDRRPFGLGRRRRRLAVHMPDRLRYGRLRYDGCRRLARCRHLRQLVPRNRCGGGHRGFVVIAVRPGHRWSKSEQRERPAPLGISESRSTTHWRLPSGPKCSLVSDHRSRRSLTGQLRPFEVAAKISGERQFAPAHRRSGGGGLDAAIGRWNRSRGPDYVSTVHVISARRRAFR